MFHIADKIYLLVFVLVPLLLLWNRFLRKRGSRYIYYSSEAFFLKSKNIKTSLALNLFYVRLFALCLIIFALARPQIMNSYEVEKTRGIDILLTLDVSGSMAAMDFKPANRLEMAKSVIENFISKRENDRIGLVVFAGSSYTKCPLTIDYDVLKFTLGKSAFANDEGLEDGTALGMALATSVNRIRMSKAKTRVIILLTDGVNNKGEIDPRDAAVIAKEFGIKVYTVGVGSEGEAPYPVGVDVFGQKQYRMFKVELDEELLKNIANSTGGLYMRATDKESFNQIFDDINRWEKSEVSAKKYTTSKELYHFFLGAGFLILILCGFLSRSWLRLLP